MTVDIRSHRIAMPATRPRRRNRVSVTPYLFLAPGLVVFTTLIVYPIVRSFQMSLFEWNIVAGATSRFIGLGNFSRAMNDPLFWRSVVNSGAYMALTVPLQMALGLLVAVLLNNRAPGRAVFRVLYYLPVVTSWVIVSLLFKYLFADEGLINWFLMDGVHATDHPISWLANRWTAMAAIAALGIWKGVGWSMVIFLAALQAVPRELEEAAALDGANTRQRFWNVSMPAIRPAIVFVAVMLVIGGMNVFTSVLLMTNGGPNDATQVVLTMMYRQAFTFLDFGYASALSVLLSAVVLTMSLMQLRLFRRSGELS